jgi:hypothetical protein
MKAAQLPRQAPRRNRNINRASVDSAHKAIEMGGATLGEIADLVTTPPRNSRFDDGAGALAMNLPDIVKPVRIIKLRDQLIFGVRFKNIFALSCCLGVLIGVPLGVALHGTAAEIALIRYLPFLG